MLTAVPRSKAAEIDWPALPDTTAASVLALQFQLDRTQYWPPDRLRDMQFVQLHRLVAHCYRAMPFYRERLRVAGMRSNTTLTPELWARLPVLTRREVQAVGARLHCSPIPAGHGAVAEEATSGSTGTAVKIRITQLSQFFWHGFVLRDVLWHDLDMSAKFAIIRNDYDGASPPPAGRALPDWGASFSAAFSTGPAALLDLRQSNTAQQVDWLLREQPAYLMTYPSNLELLAQRCLENGIAMPFLRAARPFGESVTDELRALLDAAWHVPVLDGYSAVEVGMIALQCPDHPHFHVQSEGLLLEVLREDGSACGAREVGRVVVTPLHNFAQPLLRYELGDYAECGGACTCGRTLPVLTRVLGKTIDRFVLPSGEKRFQKLAFNQLARSPAIVQMQMVQTSRSRMELRLVLRRPLTEAEEEQLRAALTEALGYPFEIAIVAVDEIAREPSGKFFAFRSEVS
jgi:phenylacetate-CoA ligase